MTNYIEEMMRTAGVEADTICKYAAGNIVYPDFTVEKQLEMIKLIADQNFIDIRKPVTTGKWTMRYTYSQNPAGRDTDFSQAISQLTTELMRAGELDKEKVKEILQQ